MEDYIFFTEIDILERVDEYTLYCFYLGQDVAIGGHMISPNVLRKATKEDHKPSFGVYTRKFGTRDTEFLWKDLGTGIHGDIFDLVKLIFGYSRRDEAIVKIRRDFGLGGQPDGILPVFPEKKIRIYANENIDIEVGSKPFTRSDLIFWKQINADEPQLNKYTTTSIKHYWLSANQKYPKYPKGLGFAYRIWNKYQLYFPYGDKENKFRSELTDVCVPGFQQLRKTGDLCIVTKSMKDVICIDTFGFDVVGVRGENILLPPEFIGWLKNNYKRILILFDNDMKHRGNDYEFEKIYVPRIKDTDKDTSDFCKNHGPDACYKMLRQITRT